MKEFLRPEQRLSYRNLHKKSNDRKKADRIKAILMLDKGFSFQETAELLLLDEMTIRRWHECFKTEGFNTMLKYNYTGGTPKLDMVQQEELSNHLESRTYLTAKEVVAYVKNKYNVEYSPKGIVKLLHRIGFAYKKPKHVPGKADTLKQEAFIREYRELKEGKSEGDHIYFMDGVHPLHNSQPAYGWIKKGKEKALRSNTGRQRININGAYDIEGHNVVIWEDESINAQSTIKLLEKMLIAQPSGTLNIILDNAKYYRSVLVKDFLEKNPRVKFRFLPPYSPNLNVIERLWKFFKKKTTYNEYYEKYSVFKEKCLAFFENIELYRDELKSLMTDNFHVIQA